jgi:hypothetical protein
MSIEPASFTARFVSTSHQLAQSITDRDALVMELRALDYPPAPLALTECPLAPLKLCKAANHTNLVQRYEVECLGPYLCQAIYTNKFTKSPHHKASVV